MTNDETVREIPAADDEEKPLRHSSFGFRHFAKRLGTTLLDLLYTRKCEGCDVFLASGREGVKQWLCERCHEAMERIVAPYCEVCGEPYEGSMSGSFRCGNCADLKLHFDFAVAGFKAEGEVRGLVHRFKYQRALHLRGLLGTLLERALHDPRLREVDASWTLVPVPLYHARQREREYNQAWELCGVLAKSRGLPALEAMSRVRSTTAQASLSRHQRIENLRGAFAVKQRVLKNQSLEGKSVLLVDDVLTTGSTTSECARVLRKEAGAAQVVVITVARG